MIDLKKAALLLGTSESMLLRWIQQGIVPVSEENGVYKFNRKNLEDWAQTRQLIRKKSIEQNLVPAISTQKVCLLSAMRSGGVHLGVKGSTVPEVLEEALEMTPIPKQWRRDKLLRRLLEREALASTGLGRGIAVPHPRYPLKNAASGGFISTCFLEKAVDYNAIDGEPVFVLFLMLNPDARSHLQLLSRLTFCLHNTEFQQRLRTCQDEDSLLRFIQQLIPRK